MKIATLKQGIHKIQVQFPKDKSDEYIRTVVKEKAPNWELVKIAMQDYEK